MATLPSKKDVLLGLLEKTSVLVHLDARRDDVEVPKQLKSNAQLILQLGLNLAVPIKDLDVSDVGVSCTLSFSRVPFFCVLPYSAIFAMVSEDGGRAMVWPEDVPAEVARAAEAEARKLGLIQPPEQDAPREPIQQSVRSAPKKTRDENKPALAPSLGPSLGIVETKRAAKTPKIARAPEAKRPEPTRPKRELPPYLRVIK